MPAARASAISSALAARMPGFLRPHGARPWPSSARSFCAVGASASTRAAARALRPISAMAAAISPVPSMLFSGALMCDKPVKAPYPGWFPITSGLRGGEVAAVRTCGTVYLGIAWITAPIGGTGQLTYTLGWQGGRPRRRVSWRTVQTSAQPFSGRHQIRDRRPARRRRPGAGLSAAISNSPTARFSRCRAHPVQRKSGASRRARKPRAPPGTEPGRALPTRARRRGWAVGPGPAGESAIGRRRPMADRSPPNRQIRQKKRGPKAPWGIVAVSSAMRRLRLCRSLMAGVGCRKNADPGRRGFMARKCKAGTAPSATICQIVA